MINEQLEIEKVDVRQRSAMAEITANLGISKWLEGHIQVPFVWRGLEVSSPSIWESDDRYGLGDIEAGFKILLRREDQFWPDLIGNIEMSIPTGKTDTHLYGSGITPGSGHWAISAGLTGVKSSDPAVLFASISGAYSFERSVESQSVQPGWQVNYRCGVGFALNPDLTVSGQFAGGYQDGLRVNGERLTGTILEPLSFQAGFTYRIDSKRYLAPAITFGLNDDALDFNIELGLSLVQIF